MLYIYGGEIASGWLHSFLFSQCSSLHTKHTNSLHNNARKNKRYHFFLSKLCLFVCRPFEYFCKPGKTNSTQHHISSWWILCVLVLHHFDTCQFKWQGQQKPKWNEMKRIEPWHMVGKFVATLMLTWQVR